MKILVVNDERAAANSVAEILRRDDHEALPLYDTIEAVEHAEHLSFDAALVTIRQGTSFFELGECLQKLMPRCRLIFVVNPDILWFVQGVVDKGIIAGNFSFLPEGFKNEDVLKKLWEVGCAESSQQRKTVFSDTSKQL
jgi:DNA-binding NtrC family response regulator